MDVYRQASEIVSLVRQGHGTAKALSLRKDMQKKKQTYAVVCETLRHYELLEDVLEVAEFFKYYPHANKELAMCMAYDVVLGKGVNTANDSTARAISQSVAYLREAYWRVHKHHIIPPKAATWDSNGDNGVNTNDNAAGNKGSTLMPRYARVNTLKIALDTLVERLRRSAENKKRLRNGDKVEKDNDQCESQLSMSTHDNNHHESNTPTQKNKNGKAGRILPDFIIDSVVPSLLVFPPNTDLHAHPAVKGGQLILQDKASCLPACILLDAVEVIRTCNSKTEHDTMQSISTSETNNKSEGNKNTNEKHKKNKNTITNTNTVTQKEQVAVIRKPLEYVIDACAAPGNKTTHLAALGAPDIKIMAIERDEHRAELLQKRVAALAASDYVNVVNMDFFDLSSDDRDATEGILLDPSCSASGVMTRVDVVVKHANEKEIVSNKSNNNNSYGNGEAQHHYHHNKAKNEKDVEEGNDEFVKKQKGMNNNYSSNEDDNGDDMEVDYTTMKSYDSKERVEQLSRIQRKMLTHALVSFNHCRTVVYSTCSIHEEENEDVVRHVLSDERVLSRGWTLSNIMPHTWQTRGRRASHHDDNNDIPMEYTIRCDPATDHTNGFFVARFDRDV